MQYRIGDRDPGTGLYDVIWPDGSFTRNGIKIFNAAHEFGDVVLVTKRSDGMLILDGVKALTEVVTSFGLGGFGDKPVGYLQGQVFNNEETIILPIVAVEFAPGSPMSLAVGAGSFVVRIKIDRPGRRDLNVRVEFTGTASSSNYTVTGLAGSASMPTVTIPAGANFADITITPIGNVPANKTIVVTGIAGSGYRVGQNNNVTATILAGTTATITVIQLCPALLETGEVGEFLVRPIYRLQRSNSTLLEKIVFSSLISISLGAEYEELDVNGIPLTELVIEAGEMLSQIIYIGTYKDDGVYNDYGFVPLHVYNTFAATTEQYQFINNFAADIHYIEFIQP